MREIFAPQHVIDPYKFSQDRVQGCDLCILLVAFRRGHVPSGERLSITQLEYRAAQELAIDTLVFILKEDAPWPRKFDELDKDPEVRRWRTELSEQRGVSFFGLPPESVEVGPAITRWLAESPFKTKPELVIQSIDFKCATPGRRNRLLLFNGHAIPVFVERLWLMREDVKYWGPTFTLDEAIAPNSIKEIISPPFRDDESAGESWAFPKDDYRAGIIQSFDTNWKHVKPGWESERWESGDPVYVKAVISYLAGDKRLLTSTFVWQGFSHAFGTHWR